MKNLLLLAALMLIGLQTMQAQTRYFTRDGYVKFFSSTPIEDIKAENHKVSCVYDVDAKKMEFAVLIKSFEFKKALMEEHFNENYMESSKYPKAQFSGTIDQAIDASKAGEVAVKVSGKMTMHGESKDVTIPGKVVVGGDGTMTLKAKFMVNPEDYKIRIPNTVRDQIAKEIEVTVDMALKKL